MIEDRISDHQKVAKTLKIFFEEAVNKLDIKEFNDI